MVSHVGLVRVNAKSVTSFSIFNPVGAIVLRDLLEVSSSVGIIDLLHDKVSLLLIPNGLVSDIVKQLFFLGVFTSFQIDEGQVLWINLGKSLLQVLERCIEQHVGVASFGLENIQVIVEAELTQELLDQEVRQFVLLFLLSLFAQGIDHSSRSWVLPNINEKVGDLLWGYRSIAVHIQQVCQDQLHVVSLDLVVLLEHGVALLDVVPEVEGCLLGVHDP